MKGRRLPDTPFHELPREDLQPGDYWKWTTEFLAEDPNVYPTNLTRTVWGFYSPDGNGLGTLLSHTVREEDDGTISIRPGDGSSNSVLHTGGGRSWHGYVEHGEWRPV